MKPKIKPTTELSQVLNFNNNKKINNYKEMASDCRNKWINIIKAVPLSYNCHSLQMSYLQIHAKINKEIIHKILSKLTQNVPHYQVYKISCFLPIMIFTNYCILYYITNNLVFLMFYFILLCIGSNSRKK